MIAYFDGNLIMSISRQSLASTREAGFSRIRSLDLLAKIYREKGQLDEAEQCHRQSLAIDRDMGIRIFEGECLVNLAHTQIREASLARRIARGRATLFNLMGSECLLPVSWQALLHQGRILARLDEQSLEEALRAMTIFPQPVTEYFW
jgi:tetratricopeptide (TPR) repeat protein